MVRVFDIKTFINIAHQDQDQATGRHSSSLRIQYMSSQGKHFMGLLGEACLSFSQ
jgi:hypothetical protein